MDGSQPTYEELLDVVGHLHARVAELEGQLEEARRTAAERVAGLEAQLEEAKRVAARQAAPFRRRDKLKKSASEKKKPGRKEGHPGSYRLPPPEVDEQCVVPLPCCPHCQGELEDVHPVEQILEELPVIQPRRYKITTFEGLCPHHGVVQSTHPLQTSFARGAASVHLGQRAQATAVALSHQTGMSVRKVCGVLRDFFGLSLSPGGLSQLQQRVATRTSDWYDDIIQQIRHSAAVYADETSWYVGQSGWWLWDFTTENATLYVVANSRGSDVVEDTLTNDYAGILVSDCLATYNVIPCRKHKCIAHHLRQLEEYEETLKKEDQSSRYLLLWKLQLKDVIETWHRRPSLTTEEWETKVAQLRRGVENLLNESPEQALEVRFRDRLRRQHDHLLGCLDDPAAEPTNNRAERDLRPAVISRKISCGNKTEAGKTAWERLRSITVTAAKQGRDLVDALRPYLAVATQ